MKVLIILASLVALTLAQGQSHTHGQWSHLQETFNDKHDQVYLDIIQNYRFEDIDLEQTDADGKHLLVAISDVNNDRSCHLIEVGSEWVDYLLDEDLTHQVTQELFDLITTHTALESELTWNELLSIYGDSEQVRDCIQHTVYELFYTPSFTTPRPSSTTPAV